MKNNEQLQNDVLHAIRWEPLLKNEEIGVIAIDGVITLTGQVDSYKKKHDAEDAAKCVSGVKAVVEKIEVKFGETEINVDNEIADEVLSNLKKNFAINNQKVKVENGWVTLEGELRWNNQKQYAKSSIISIIGVKGVTNNITIIPDQSTVEKKNIEYALARNWAINEQDVNVKVSGNQVVLTGVVHSLYQKEQAEKISWNAPGVWSVVNELLVR